MQLYNKLSSEERSKILDTLNQKRITLSFYQYAKIDDPKQFRDDLFIFWNNLNVLGRIYIAKEGINAQLSLPEENLKTFKEHLKSISFLSHDRFNIELKIEGLLLTMYDTRLRLSNQVVEEVKTHFQDLVFRTIIHRNVRLGESPSFGETIVIHDASSKGAINYLNLANEILTKVAISV